MIDITKLSDKDVGRWVVYKDDTASREVGKIKSWNNSGVFVVYNCAGNWEDDLWKEYTSAHTSPQDLEFYDLTSNEELKRHHQGTDKDYSGMVTKTSMHADDWIGFTINQARKTFGSDIVERELSTTMISMKLMRTGVILRGKQIRLF